ncbi:mycofactocin-coupled SDR family oxidoreductase [Mycobacterium kubicae]|uniref:mycofactocin-coupled SDR family oxidoreductase n=1 Tax=Mycobacterium kubicae TaxID=120959 RepID=UPI00164137A4|nr:mycofactocin-coupled SDR family oxidoreductase [Mycobacterium kubicae]QNI05952.1 mycofactocin-coupled SDR family oxidoreductase [Mycobacterium kubicae]
MVDRVAGKVAFITGAARGQGRSHAVGLAGEGADIIAVDICTDVKTAPYRGATEDDLAHTVKLVEAAGRRILPVVADVRDLAALQAAVRQGVETFGGIDIAIANAGIVSFGSTVELEEDTWQTMLDVNLTGTWKTVKAVAPAMIERRQGGSIILISSIAGLVAFVNLAHYVAAKHGVTGLMRALAAELAPHGIRVNSVHPGTVHSPMFGNLESFEAFTGVVGATSEQVAKLTMGMNALAVPWLEEADVTPAIVYLSAEESRYVTGTTAVIDAGAVLPFKIPHC